MKHRAPLSPAVLLALGAVCIGFAPIFVKCVDLGPAAIGFYRCAVAATILLAMGRASGSHGGSRRSSVVFWIVCGLAGLTFATDLAVWHRSVIWAGAGMGTILGNTQVFYLGLIGIFAHRERLTLRYGISVPLAFGGILLLVGVGSDGVELADTYGWGVFFGLLTGVIYATFLFVMRWLETVRAHRSTPRLLGLVTLSAAVALGVTAAIEGSWRLPTRGETPWLLLLGIIPHVCGWFLITRNLPRVPMSRSGLILLIQPVLATCLGAIFFRERLTVLQVAGALGTLGAIYLGTTRLRQREAAGDPSRVTPDR